MTLQRCNVRDLFSLTSRKITDEGYLVAPAKVARTGIQVYRASELGLDKSKGMAADALVRLHRPREEVFAPEAMASFDRKPVTDDHPPEGVTASNWNQTAVGDAHDPTCAGETMDMELVVRDPDAINAVQSDGKVQMSCGYGFDLDMTSGTTADGQAYDGIMRNIRGNHVAIVDYARGGSGLRIADRDPNRTQGDPMALVKIVLDGITLELEQTQASLVEKIDRDAKAAVKTAQDARATAETKATAAETALAAANEAKAKLVADHATALAESKAKEATPAQIEALAAERSQVVADALVLVPEIKPAGKSVPAIRAEVLAAAIAGDSAFKPVVLAALGKDKDGKDVDPAKAPEDKAKGAFDVLVAAHGATASDDDGEGSVNDPAVARALAGDSTRNPVRPGAAPKAISGRALLMYREQHAGKDPSKATA